MLRKNNHSAHGARRGRRRRNGGAVVELAVCLPVIALIGFGSMEAASMIFLRQALVQSAYETVKESVKTNGDQATARLRGKQVLEAREINGETISFEPALTDDLPRGTPVTVTVTAPGDSNSVISFGPFKGQKITVTATMLKE